MNPETFKILGQIAGIGGVALGLASFIFREIIRKSIFPTLSKEHAYKLLRLIVVLAWLIGILGVMAWIYQGRSSETKNGVLLHSEIVPSLCTRLCFPQKT